MDNDEYYFFPNVIEGEETKQIKLDLHKKLKRSRELRKKGEIAEGSYSDDTKNSTSNKIQLNYLQPHDIQKQKMIETQKEKGKDFYMENNEIKEAETRGSYYQKRQRSETSETSNANSSNEQSEISSVTGANQKIKKKKKKRKKKQNDTCVPNIIYLDSSLGNNEDNQDAFGVGTNNKTGNNKNMLSLKNFKINYQKLNTKEKKYYNYMMKHLNVNFDSSKCMFYADSSFISNFINMVKNEKRNFNTIGYFEFATSYLLQWLTPTKEEKLLKLKSLLKLESVVKSLYPKAKVEAFGSYTTGLSLPGGDLDVCISNIQFLSKENIETEKEIKDSNEKNIEKETKEEHLVLYLIGYALVKLNICLDIKILKDAKVPILKYKDRETGTAIDVCINQKSSKESTDFIAEKVKQFTYLRPLVLLLKFFLNSRCLNDTYSGGIGSFMLSCMALHFLQLHPSSFDRKESGNTYLFILLIEFFRFYSIDYNIADKCVILRGLGHCMPKHLRKEFKERERLSIENPVQPHTDIGVNTYRIKFIMYLFSYSYCNLIALLKKMMKKESIITNYTLEDYKTKENKKNKFIEGNKLNTKALYPLFYGCFLNPDDIMFIKRKVSDFPNMKWSIFEFDSHFSQEEKRNMLEMIFKDMHTNLNHFYKYRNFELNYEHNFNLFANFSKTFPFTFHIENNIFKYTD